MQRRKASDIYADFNFSEVGKTLLKCAGGQTLLTSKYYEKTIQCRSTFDKDKCNQCSYKDQCKPNFDNVKLWS